MNKTVRIAGRDVGEGCQPFIVAEAGINHNGEIEKVFEMIRVARRAGVDAIKFQTFKADELVADATQLFTYKSQGRQVTEPMIEMFRRYELEAEAWPKIKDACDREGIAFLSTPQNRSDLDLLLPLGISAVKVGSDDFSNHPLLKNYARTGLPLILSCGMADMGEVRQSLEAVGAMKGYPTILLVCTSEYPTPPEHANILRLKTLSSEFPGLLLGFSDHTQGSAAALLAAALGACFFEKHFTLDRDLPGPDHWFSEDPASLKSWADSIRQAKLMLGSGLVRPTPQEEFNKKEFRRVVVAIKKILRGEIYTEQNIAMRRKSGGKGLAPSRYPELLGKAAGKNYEKDEAIEG